MSAEHAKRCTKCGETKPLDAFRRDKWQEDGYRPNCKACGKGSDRRKATRTADRRGCEGCGQDISMRTARTRFCTDACRAATRTGVVYAAKSCKNCGTDTTKRERSSVYCSKRCRNAGGNYWAARRARLANAPHEPYIRSAIFAAYNNECAYCAAPAEHLDHVVALARGGADAAHNLLPACAPCNLSKGAKSLAEWALSWN